MKENCGWENHTEQPLENLDKINCIHEWYETENYYIKCKKCNKLKEYGESEGIW